MSKNCFRALNSRWLFLTLYGLSLLYVFLNRSVLVLNYWLIAQSLIIGVAAVLFLCNKKTGFLGQVVGIFVLLFFSIFPILEVLTATTYWNGSELSAVDRNVANLIVAIFLLLFTFGYAVDAPMFLDRGKWLNLTPDLHWRVVFALTLIALSGFLYLLSLLRWNINGLFVRSGPIHEGVIVQSKPLFLIVEFFLRPLIFNIGISVFIFFKKNSWISSATLILGVLAMFPTGIPRFAVGAMYLPFLLIGFYMAAKYLNISLIGHRMILPNILMACIFFAFPLLDIFRWHSDGDSLSVFGVDTILAGHFDAYQMLVRALKVGEVSSGEGFLGALLFFIPREFWPSKPSGSGQMISHLSNLSFDNVSMPLVGEFYLNFGFAGVVVLSCILGFLFKQLDMAFRYFEMRKISIPILIYLQLIGFVFLILRGGFLSAFAYTISMLLSWFLIIFICRAMASAVPRETI